MPLPAFFHLRQHGRAFTGSASCIRQNVHIYGLLEKGEIGKEVGHPHENVFIGRLREVWGMIVPGAASESYHRVVELKMADPVSRLIEPVNVANLRAFNLISELEYLGVPAAPYVLPEPVAATVDDELLDSFSGWVDAVRNGQAYVTLRDQRGVVSEAKIPAERLIKHHVGVGEPFQCVIRSSPKGADMSISPVPRLTLTDEDYRRMREELDHALPEERLARIVER